MNEEAIKTLVTGSLIGEEWAQKTAEQLIAMVAEFEEFGSVQPADLPPNTVNVTDPIEEFCRAHAEASLGVSLPLLLPSAWVHAGAVGQGGWWASWDGRDQVHVVPLTDHHIGLAGSGAGKTTMQDVLSLPFEQGRLEGAEHVKRYLDELGSLQRNAVDSALEDWRDVCNGPQGMADKKLGDAYAGVRLVLMRAVDTVAVTAMKRTSEAGGGANLADTTVEAVVSLASEVGGAILVRASEQDFLDNLTRYSSAGQSGSLSVLTQGWDGAPYARMRQGTGIQDVPSLVLSLALMTQDESFAKMFNGPAGVALLDKGVLGRAWMTRGEDVDPVEVAVAELQRLQDARDGVSAEGLDAAGLAQAFGRIAVAGAQARALRAVQGRVKTAALSDKGALGLSTDAISELNKAADMAEFVVGQAVSRYSVVLNGGVAGGAAGVVLQVGRKDSIRLESLFSLCKMLAGDDPVLAPSLTRYVSHVVRIAGIRAAVAAGCGDEAEWAKFLSDGEIPGEWIADTAERTCIWWLRQHLSVTAKIRDEQIQTATRETALKEHRIADASLEGLTAKRMVDAAMTLPKTVSEVSRLIAKKGGKFPGVEAKNRYKAISQMFNQIAKDGDSEYFKVSKKSTGGPVALIVEPGPAYLDMMKARATG